MKQGDYYSLVGSYEGVVWVGRRWERFLCGGCARAAGIVKRRLQGPMSPAAEKALHGPVYYKHSPALHAEWLKQKSHLQLNPTSIQ